MRQFSHEKTNNDSTYILPSLKGNVQFIDAVSRMRVVRGEGEGRMGDLFFKVWSFSSII